MAGKTEKEGPALRLLGTVCGGSPSLFFAQDIRCFPRLRPLKVVPKAEERGRRASLSLGGMTSPRGPLLFPSLPPAAKQSLLLRELFLSFSRPFFSFHRAAAEPKLKSSLQACFSLCSHVSWGLGVCVFLVYCFPFSPCPKELVQKMKYQRLPLLKETSLFSTVQKARLENVTTAKNVQDFCGGTLCR